MSKRTGFILFGICALLVSSDGAGEQFLVRLRSSASGIQEPAGRLGLEVLGTLDPGRSTYIVRSPDNFDGGSWLVSLSSDPDIEAAEPVSPVHLPELQSISGDYDFESSIRAWLSTYGARKLLGSRSHADYFGDSVWISYLAQPLVRITELAGAQRMATGRGVTVAVIDTGIANHPALERDLVPGYDFLREQVVAGEDELPESDVDAPDPQQGTTVVLNVLQRAPGGYWGGGYDAPTLGQQAALGHGTMIAGIVHLIAPRASIMPLRVFGPDGRTDTASIIRAIYYAVDQGAEVINMSFSTSELSPELARAIDYATARGVICVASAGNQAREGEAYPASLPNVVGVAATDNSDRRSLFSNYGRRVADIAAPGEGIFTTHLDGAYAVGWGTSFSTALVTGAVALLLDVERLDQAEVAETLSRTAARVSRDLGRVDLLTAVQRALSLRCGTR
jgi:subtilisin family serine protease